jgi:Cytosol aminopeptidase family, N-terminal domain
MDLSFFPLTLEAIDQAAAESLCLFIGADERPLTGLAGLADWRLQGRLSRLLRSGSLTGESGEAVLTPPGSRLGFRKLFLFGLGPAGLDEATLSLRLSEGLRKIAEAGVQEAALQLPAKLTAEAGIRALLAVTGDKLGPSRAMVFSADPQKLMAALSQAASRGQAQVERRVVKVPGPSAPPVLQPPKKQPPQPGLSKVGPLPFARDLPPPLITPPSPIPKASLPLATAVTQQRPTDESAIAQAISAPPPAKPIVDESTVELVAAAVAASQPDDIPVAPALPPSVPPPASDVAPAVPESAPPAVESAPPKVEAALPLLQPQASQPPGKRPAPPPPPPPPPAAPKRPAPTPSQRYIPPEPTQNVFDRSKRKKR